ncbi:F-type H+-transporting ATPase subunit epsilon [Faecalicatena contorta]|uniref:ATP synthase epsilon chain n=1 Tax=Faecalicatena contorta TaxID=39482 RepID=A0A315ZNM9_9FIRM|nr:F-type H+-transporting ATPase subunit epsilon [Faecalicatena contorta]SUQ16156.1 F-type H+-transporting ATPase subunit epsilon [Faecalicatena contorta]
MAGQQTNVVNDRKINLNITTPRGVKFVEKADMIIMRCIDGNMGALLGHEPVSTILGDGILRIFNNGVEKKLAVFGGIAEIGNTTVNIFTTIAQHPEEIDRERAEEDRQSAEATILEASEELKFRSSYILLRRSLVRIEVSLHLEDDEEYSDDEETNSI